MIMKGVRTVRLLVLKGMIFSSCGEVLHHFKGAKRLTC